MILLLDNYLLYFIIITNLITFNSVGLTPYSQTIIVPIKIKTTKY